MSEGGVNPHKESTNDDDHTKKIGNLFIFSTLLLNRILEQQMEGNYKYWRKKSCVDEKWQIDDAFITFGVGRIYVQKVLSEMCGKEHFFKEIIFSKKEIKFRDFHLISFEKSKAVQNVTISFLFHSIDLNSTMWTHFQVITLCIRQHWMLLPIDFHSFYSALILFFSNNGKNKWELKPQ